MTSVRKRWAMLAETKGEVVIRILEDLPKNVLGVEASAKVTDDDYERVLVPALRERIEADGKIRFIYVLGDEFDGWTPGAMWEDAKLGIGELKAWEKVAVVTDNDWVQHMVKAFGWMIPGDVRLFDLGDLEKAKVWAAS